MSRSLWGRAWSACSSASRTRSLRIERDTRQPTMARENTSMTKATYTKPAQLATYVKSATQSWLGRLAENSRFTRSAGRAASRRVLVIRRRGYRQHLADRLDPVLATVLV